MNASKLFAAVAAVVVAGSAVAADLPVANASVSAAAAAAQVSVAAKSLNVPAILVDKSASPTRAQIRAEAVEAVKNHRSTDSSQFDWFNN
jgi:hypothetical protein